MGIGSKSGAFCTPLIWEELRWEIGKGHVKKLIWQIASFCGTSARSYVKLLFASKMLGTTDLFHLAIFFGGFGDPYLVEEACRRALEKGDTDPNKLFEFAEEVDSEWY